MHAGADRRHDCVCRGWHPTDHYRLRLRAEERSVGPWQLGCYDDELLPGLTEMVRSVHSTGSKIALQLAHGGIFGYRIERGRAAGPSPLQTEEGPLGREMDTEEMGGTLDAFGAAAGRR